MDADSARWIDRLRNTGADGRDAVAELHALLLRVARAETGRRAPQSRIAGPELDDIAHQATADALLAVTAKLDTFRGESRFTTWAFKFVIFEVVGKLSRHFWQRASPHSDEPDWEQLPSRFGIEPEAASDAADVLETVRVCVEQELTSHQRAVFTALVLDGMPLDVLAQQLGTTRNAIYKTMFDVRRKLRAALVADGLIAGRSA